MRSAPTAPQSRAQERGPGAGPGRGPTHQAEASSLGIVKQRIPRSSLPRLTEPLVREAGRLRPATWEEALDRAAQGLANTRSAFGADALGMFSCSKSTNEVNFVAQKLMRVAIGSNNIDSCNRT